MDKQKKIGEKIRIARKEAGLTQKELGVKIGYSAMGISYLEKGLRKMKIIDIENIANALNADINILLHPITQIVSSPDSFHRIDGEEITHQQQVDEEKALKEFDNLIRRGGK